MALRLPQVDVLHAALKGKLNILMVDYRGYGNSEGAPDEEGIGRDIDAILEYLGSCGKVDASNVFVYGQSLGGAVAVRGATGPHGSVVRALILENTFTSISDMVDKLFPMVTPCKRVVLRIYWPTLDRIRELSRIPTLFLSGAQDELIPASHMRALFDAHPAKGADKTLVSVRDGHHNDTWQRGGWQYFQQFAKFIKRHATGRAAELAHVPDGPWWTTTTASPTDGAAPPKSTLEPPTAAAQDKKTDLSDGTSDPGEAPAADPDAAAQPSGATAEALHDQADDTHASSDSRDDSGSGGSGDGSSKDDERDDEDASASVRRRHR